jgi:hypothetical protein
MHSTGSTALDDGDPIADTTAYVSSDRHQIPARHCGHPQFIDGTDSQIDRLVYELHDLTEEEIATVNGAVR